jgi:hypothetical protein
MEQESAKQGSGLLNNISLEDTAIALVCQTNDSTGAVEEVNHEPKAEGMDLTEVTAMEEIAV